MFGKKSSSTQTRSSWRNLYLQEARALIKRVATTLPEEINLPITFKKTAFELGGSAKNFGTTIIIGDAKGYPSSGKLVHKPFSNGLQAEINIWPGCIIGIADHNKGSEVLAIYRVKEIQEAANFDEFGKAKAERIAFKKGNTQSGSSKDTWFDNLKVDYWCIEEFARILKDKLYTTNCISPMYIEWFTEIKHQLMLRRNFFNINASWYNSGICDDNAIIHPASASFSDFYDDLAERAMDVHTKYRITIAMIGHYFGVVTEDGAIEALTEFSDTTDFTKCVLVTEGRIVATNKYERNPSLVADEHVFTYIHNFDKDMSLFYTNTDEEGNTVVSDRINPSYFLSDPTFISFTHKHPGDYVGMILNKRFYQDIKNNLNPRPYAATDRSGNPVLNEDGSRKIITPEMKVHPETLTSMLLFTGSTKSFFADIKENFIGKERTVTEE